MRLKRKQRKYRKHLLAEAIMSLVGTTVSASAGITGAVLQKKMLSENRYAQAMYAPVYLSGKTFESVKYAMYTSYKKDYVLFRRYYDEWMEARKADLENGSHPSQQFKMKHFLWVGIALLVGLILILIITKRKTA
jgi:hypothetical protein